MRERFADAYKQVTGRAARPAAGAPSTSGVSSVEAYLVEAGKAPDQDMARRFVADHAAAVRYCGDRGEWLVWDGRRWAWDKLGRVVELAKQTTDHALTEALATDDMKMARALVGARQAQRIAAVLDLARTDPAVAVLARDLDRDRFALNCQNGTLDLRSGVLRPHNPADLITKLTAANFDAAARSATFRRFLRDATGGDSALESYLQRGSGYSCCGDTREEVLFFLYGPPNGGKTTFLETLGATLGDYATTADFESFLADRKAGGAREDIASLAGVRFVRGVEVDQGKRLAEGLVKLLTGGDSVRARFLFKNSFEFKPQFKLWLGANSAPRARAEDAALWRRIRRAPFEHPPKTPDKRVKAELVDPERSGAAVLAWAVEGFKQWWANGLGTADSVERSTAAYRRDVDRLRDFKEDRLVFGEGHQADRAGVYREYFAWCEAEGESHRVSRIEFLEQLRGEGVTEAKVNGAWILKGVGILTRGPHPESSGSQGEGFDAPADDLSSGGSQGNQIPESLHTRACEELSVKRFPLAERLPPLSSNGSAPPAKTSPSGATVPPAVAGHACPRLPVADVFQVGALWRCALTTCRAVAPVVAEGAQP